MLHPDLGALCCRQRNGRSGKPLTMTALPDHDLDFDSELEPATLAAHTLLGWTRRLRLDPDYLDELQAWADGFEEQPVRGVDRPSTDPDVQVNLAAGEHFRGSWRRRLADAQGDFGHVARQMRKAGVPLELALAVLLMPDPSLQAAQTSMTKPSTPRLNPA